MELKRVPLGLPRDASYSLRFREEELVLRVVLGKSSFAQAQGLRWSPQHSFFFYLAMTVPAREEGGLRGDPLLPCGSSLLQTFCCCSPADEKESSRRSTAPQTIARVRTATGPYQPRFLCCFSFAEGASCCDVPTSDTGPAPAYEVRGRSRAPTDRGRVRRRESRPSERTTGFIGGVRRRIACDSALTDRGCSCFGSAGMNGAAVYCATIVRRQAVGCATSGRSSHWL